MHSTGRFTGFNKHPKIDGTHAFLSPSSYHWLNYDGDKLLERLRASEAAARGTRLHETAAAMIRDGIMVHPDSPIAEEVGSAYVAYVNDAIRYKLIPEQALLYSLNCYGTADAIGFEPYSENEEFVGFLRINDLKTGVSQTSEKQLYVYAGVFCLEYDYNPYRIEGELSIYQGEKIRRYVIDRNFLAKVCDTIITHDNFINENRTGGY